MNRMLGGSRPAGELQRQIRSWLAENFDFLSVTGDDASGGTTGQLELLSTAVMDGWMAGLGVALPPHTDALGQLQSEYAKQVYNSQLQHLKGIAGTLATEEAEDASQVAKMRSALDSTRGSTTPFIIKCGANSNSEPVIKADANVQEPKGGEIVRVVPRPLVLENMSLEEMKHVFSQLPEALSLLALARTADGTRARYSRLYRTLAMKVPSLRDLVGFGQGQVEGITPGFPITPGPVQGGGAGEALGAPTSYRALLGSEAVALGQAPEGPTLMKTRTASAGSSLSKTSTLLLGPAPPRYGSSNFCRSPSRKDNLSLILDFSPEWVGNKGNFSRLRNHVGLVDFPQTASNCYPENSVGSFKTPVDRRVLVHHGWYGLTPSLGWYRGSPGSAT
ncbi:hypothetical protein Dsin_015971 [Dipteronia sinensis]|uniref:Uncharacterized protein n=1 Tax=Dipteronia sinensis TaxID=43782 RepID=A0AAE0E5J0_9ROSI|nr:hypothetical protein Dsin_015971 [Dipteronia sinensis]